MKCITHYLYVHLPPLQD